MTTYDSSGPRFAASDFQSLDAVGGRLFPIDAATPCRVDFDPANDLWFSPYRNRERAAKQCLDCPFLGRCSYNAVASRATYGVWAGEVLPGDSFRLLVPVYQRLLAQFERRRSIELGDEPPPPMPEVNGVRRRRPRRPKVAA